MRGLRSCVFTMRVIHWPVITNTIAAPTPKMSWIHYTPHSYWRRLVYIFGKDILTFSIIHSWKNAEIYSWIALIPKIRTMLFFPDRYYLRHVYKKIILLFSYKLSLNQPIENLSTTLYSRIWTFNSSNI
jgi:hypothetical protein